IKPTLGHELRRLDDPGGRRIARELAHLVVRDDDAALAILVLQQDLGDHLVEDAVLDAVLIVLGQRPTARLLLLVLYLGVDALEVDRIRDLGTVDDSDRRSGGHRWPADQTRRFVEEEATDEYNGDEHPDVFRQAPHLLQHGTKLRGAGVKEKSARNRTSQACNVRSGRG